MRKVKFLIYMCLIFVLSLSISQMYLGSQHVQNRATIEDMALSIENMDKEEVQEKERQIILVLTIDEDFMHNLEKLRAENKSMEDYIKGFSRLMEQKYDFSGHQQQYERWVK